MSETATPPARPGTAQPYADVLQNVGKPSLSADTDMPVIDLAKPGQGNDGELSGEPEGESGAGIDGAGGGAETGDTSAKPEGEGDAPPKPKGEEGGEEGDKTSPQQRAAFARERNRRQAAEKSAEELRTQVANLAEAVSKLTKDLNPPKEDTRPTRDTFEDPDAYDKALVDWATRQATDRATADVKADFQRRQQDGQRQALVDTYKSRETAFQADHPDFEDTVYADDVKITPAMTQAILEAEDGPAIAYHLGQNPEVAERIAGLSPAQQVTELGRISVKLATPPPKPKPEPIRPLNTRNTAGPKDPSEMSMDEYAAHRKSQAN